MDIPEHYTRTDGELLVRRFHPDPSTSTESIEREADESMALTKYVPTTVDVLNMYLSLRQKREQAVAEESHSGGSRAETLSPSLAGRGPQTDT